MPKLCFAGPVRQQIVHFISHLSEIHASLIVGKTLLSWSLARGFRDDWETHLEAPGLVMQIVKIDIVGVGESVHGVPRDFIAGVVANSFECDDGGETHALFGGEASGWEGESDRDAVEKDAFDGVHVEC